MTEDLDFESRQLCPDGACIGVIGPSGRCKVCGRAGDPALATSARATSYEPDDDGADEVDAAAAAELEESPFDDDRQLCPDDACIGIIGPDGRCKVCGRAGGSS
jgi:hypothetical protein